MSSLSIVSAAIASAIAVAQPVHLPQEYDSISHILPYEELADEVDIAELTNRIFMAERTLFALYQIASNHNEIFKNSTNIEWMNMFRESAKLLFTVKGNTQDNKELLEVTNQFEDTLNKVTRLFKSCEYHTRAEKVISSRLYTGPESVGMVFDGSLSYEEKKQLLLSKLAVRHIPFPKSNDLNNPLLTRI